jgi:hypothetical protein
MTAEGRVMALNQRVGLKFTYVRWRLNSAEGLNLRLTSAES